MKAVLLGLWILVLFYKILECQCLNLEFVKVENLKFILTGFSNHPISILDLWAVFHL